VKDAIRQSVDFQVRQGRRGVLLGLAQHVMPLQDLMKDDPVDETA
jgi:hypothetical protein